MMPETGGEVKPQAAIRLDDDQVFDLLSRGGWNPHWGSGWIRSRCPAHQGDDRNAAFRVSDHGHLIARCWSHDCPPKEIRAALSLPDHEARYPYEGRTGSVSYARRTNSPGGKTYSMRGDRERHPLLYGTTGPIVLTEGETAAEAVVAAFVGEDDSYRAASFPWGRRGASQVDNRPTGRGRPHSVGGCGRGGHCRVDCALPQATSHSPLGCVGRH